MPKKSNASTSNDATAPIWLQSVMDQIGHIVETLYTGNGQEPILPRLTRIEATLKTAAESSLKASENFKEVCKENVISMNSLDEKLETLTDDVKDLTTSVKKHQDSLHFSQVLKKPKYYVVAFIIFFFFFSLATYLHDNGIGWASIVLKWLGI